MLSLVKKASELQHERTYANEFIEINGLSLLRGSLSEFYGQTSAGKSSFVFSLFAMLTNNGEVCALVDVNNSFDPPSAKSGGIKLNNLLWIKCGGDVEAAFTASDYLIQARSFGAIWINLNDTPQNAIDAIPTASWYRFRNKIKDSPTLLILTTAGPVIGSAKQQSIHLSKTKTIWTGIGKFKLLKEFRVNLESQKPLLTSPIKTLIRKEY